MKKEYTLALIASLFLLAYVLEAVINPLTIDLASPYEYLKPQYLTQYPFTSAVIAIRSLAIFLTPLFLLSFIKKAFFPKGIALIILAGLMQLYSLQNILNNTNTVPLEWALSLALAGITLIAPALLYFFRGLFHSMYGSLAKTTQGPLKPDADKPPDWLG